MSPEQIKINVRNLSIISACLSCFFFLSMYTLRADRKEILENGIETVGTIVGHKSSFNRLGGCYKPIIEFTAHDGKTYDIWGEFCEPKNSTVNYKGRKISLKYDRNNPNLGTVLGNELSHKKNDLIFTAIAIVLLIFAVLPLFSVKTFYEKRLENIAKNEDTHDEK